MYINRMEITPNYANKFHCNICDFKCSKNIDWTRHILTRKHINRTNINITIGNIWNQALQRPDGSGTVAALDAGVHAIGKKILEEAGEVWLAAEHESDEALAEEISQLIYHVQTLMGKRWHCQHLA